MVILGVIELTVSTPTSVPRQRGWGRAFYIQQRKAGANQTDHEENTR